MRILAIVDPPSILAPQADTTVAILDEAARRGHTVYCAEMPALWLRGEEAMVDAHRVSAISRTAPPALAIEGSSKEAFPLAHFQVVFMRKDPPYDAAYHLATLILERARGQTLLLNDPRGLREANEKLYIFHFPDLIAPTLVTSDLNRLRAFLDEHGEIVAKPIDGHGGVGIFYVHRDDRNARSIFETMTNEGKRWIMAQRYLSEVRQGDKRVLILDGEPIGALLRVPQADDIRGNMHVGGTPTLSSITERDRQICARIAPRLERDGLLFVGIDIIGGYLTEVNVTSPTGVQQIDRLQGIRLEEKIVDYLEKAAPRSL